tara:strand:+ start:4234 stop:5415 length:1182 start_codon:yes stop_codon:yes gene_type:complete
VNASLQALKIAAVVSIGLSTGLLRGSEEAGPSQVSAKALEHSIERGVAFLIEAQNSNGSWGSARQTKGLNIYAPVPGAHDAFRTAVTAMSVSALIDSGAADVKGSAAAKSVETGTEFLLENLPLVRRATADAIYNVWTHAYGIQAMVDIYPRVNRKTKKRVAEVVVGQIDRLGRYESVDGGWGYYDFRAGTKKPSSSSISFTTATCLVALHEAKSIPGITVPDKLVERAIAATNRQRKSDHSYLYGEYLRARPLYGINRPAGSLGRSQACNFALRIWGDETVSNEVIVEWLDRLAERNGWLGIGRKRPIPHEAWFQIAGYFYYYGHYYAGLSLRLLPEEERVIHQQRLAGILMELQEKDGSWWDFPFYSYHQPYGTAFAVMTLARCRQDELSQ